MKYMIKALEYYYRRVKTRILWKKNNMHNFTWPANSFDVDNVKVGKYSYGPISVFNDTSNKLIIGNFCSIAENVKFIVGGEHYTNYISTFPFNHYFNNVDVEAFSKGNIVLEDDVWVGYGSIILSNVRIGQGAVIAAGSVVTKDVPPYAIVGGNPAKILKYRFNKDVINELLKIDFSKLTKKEIISNIDELNKKLNDVSQLKWLLKK